MFIIGMSIVVLWFGYTSWFPSNENRVRVAVGYAHSVVGIEFVQHVMLYIYAYHLKFIAACIHCRVHVNN